jgi:hypothetical protein
VRTSKTVNIALVHIGGDIPSYLLESIRQIRVWFRGPVFLVVVNAKRRADNSIFSRVRRRVVLSILARRFGLTLITQLSKSVRLTEQMRAAEILAVYGRHYVHAMQRLFVLEAAMHNSIQGPVIHIENDVMIYCDPTQMKWPDIGIYINPVSDEFATWAFAYLSSASVLADVNRQHMELLRLGDKSLLARYGHDNVNEMLFAGEFVRCGLLKPLPTLPTEGVAMLFDGSAFGQYAGGTHESPPGWAERGRYVGEALLDRKIDLAWRTDELNRKYPVCLDLINKTETRLGNLHIHSKRLHEFKS